MSWNYELLVRERQRELQREADQARLAALARQAGSGWRPLLSALRQVAAQVRSAARLRSRIAA
jgi:hypothetical protein